MFMIYGGGSPLRLPAVRRRLRCTGRRASRLIRHRPMSPQKINKMLNKMPLPLLPCRPPSCHGPAPSSAPSGAPPRPPPLSPCPRPPPSATSRARPRYFWISEMLAKCWQSVGKKLPTFANTLPTLSRFSRGGVYHNFMLKGGADFCQHFANTLPTFCQHFGNPRISGAGPARRRGRGPGTEPARGGGGGRHGRRGRCICFIIFFCADEGVGDRPGGEAENPPSPPHRS